MILEREGREEEKRVFFSFSPNPKNRENPERKKKQRKRGVDINLGFASFVFQTRKERELKCKLQQVKKLSIFLTFRHLFFRKI